jgi:Flp pilus assembly secretin CpaC
MNNLFLSFRTFSWLTTLTLLTLQGQTAEALAQAEVLAIGEQKQIDLPAGARFSLGNPEVLQAKLVPMANGAGGGILVKGKSQGYSDLWIFAPDGKSKSLEFRIISKKQASLLGDSEKLVPNLGQDLKIEPLSGGWIATGKAQKLADWNRLQAIESQGKTVFQGLAELHPMERLKAESKIQRLFRQANLHHLTVRGVGNYILLEGSCVSKEEKAFAEELARQVFRPLKSFLDIPFEKGSTLRYRAKILEIAKSSAHELGIRWEQGIPTAMEWAKGGTRGNLSWNSALKFLEQTGQVKVLSQPELLLNEKGVAELKVGGEIPISLVSKESANVQWKPYGLHLRLEVPGSSKRKSRTKIMMELSSLDPANGVDSIPGIRISKMETVVDVKYGRPVILSGLMDHRQVRSVHQLPMLADLPILGSLFQSENFRTNKSELMIALEVFPTEF